MPRKMHFEVGQQIAGVEILEVIESLIHQESRYRIRYACCDTERWMSHKCLTLRVRRRGNRCRECSVRVALISKGQGKYGWSNGQIYIPGWGLTLGKMGHRHGDKGPEFFVKVRK